MRENKTLRYGENPHQKGTFYGNLNEVFRAIKWQRTFLQQSIGC